MNSNDIIDILKHPNENGLTLFVLGVLFILSVYHFLLYFQHKDRTYLFYSLYTFLLFIGLLNRPEQGFLTVLVEPFKPFLDHLSLNFILIYNLVYIIFASKIIELKLHFEKWYRFYYWIVLILFCYAVVLELLFLITGNIEFVLKGHVFFTVFSYLISILFYIPLIKIDNPLKYYLLVGATFLILTSLAVSIIKRMDLTYDEKEIRYSIFYIGIIIENLFFSLALGHKQKIILGQKNESQNKLIKQLRENEILQKKIEEQLQIDIEVLNKQAEIERLEKQQARYGREMAELKISALRSQMNPHFIFNSLNSIKRYIIDNEKENAVYYLNKFSKLIRKVLATTREREISLSDELETMELYVNIENIRFNNQIDFGIDVEGGLQINTIKVPSLILQPFLENAIWHGLSLKESEKKLEIKIKKEGKNHIQIEVVDNGIGRKRSAEIKKKKIHQPDSIGIKLTEERLKNFAHDYKSGYALEFSDLEDSKLNITGTKVTLKIPIK